MLIKQIEQLLEQWMVFPFVLSDWSTTRGTIYGVVVGSPGVTIHGDTVRINNHVFEIVRRHSMVLSDQSEDFEYLRFPEWYRTYEVVQFLFDGDPVAFAERFPDIAVVSEKTSLSYDPDSLSAQTRRRRFIELANTGNIISVEQHRTRKVRVQFAAVLPELTADNDDFISMIAIGIALFSDKSFRKMPLEYRPPNLTPFTKGFIKLDHLQRQGWGHETWIVRELGLEEQKRELKLTSIEQMVSREIVGIVKPILDWVETREFLAVNGDEEKEVCERMQLREAIRKVLKNPRMWGVVAFTQEFFRSTYMGVNRFLEDVIKLREKDHMDRGNRKLRSLIFSSPARGGIIPGTLRKDGVEPIFGQIKRWRNGVKTYSGAIEEIIRYMHRTKFETRQSPQGALASNITERASSVSA